ncbi:AfsR/SARP family transcriptional regulator [Paractinoplanes atraurantiacus]|uniref:Predicted ATPase n=1 Tax=Paractinoplanes atraurantiacus TaxID=1036182 RepID=A0A285KLQ2_9ACTN|nr:BTAD domain-containing putative transcriptional regulator [Actinoplanes atraurantiacus]SNY73548.1 Predicted ATPase [Actinoplanes atraurantiacus]
MGVEVGLLGPVELRVDGRVAGLSGAPQRVLLARLALAGGRVVPVGELIEALWEEAPPGNAVGNLHSYVSRLRRHAGGDAVRREPGGYRLVLPDGAIDVSRVERLVAVAGGQGDEQAAETLAEALGVWRGDPLSGVAERLTFAPEVARLAEWRRHLREEWLARRVAAGRGAEALPEIEACATAEPMRERPHLLWMRALHQTGRTAEALAVAKSFRERIADEHGIDPSPALDELQQRILGEDPALRPSVRAARPARPDRFFGRRDEMAVLRKALQESRVTTLVGPGGVGKTRLMTEALAGDELLVELAERSVPADVAAAVAGALGLRAAPRGAVAAIAERLGGSAALLVLDNCEHLLEAVRDLVGEIVRRCPRVRVLATSRQRLGVAGERVLRLGPLPEQDRVALFCDRAALLRAGFPADARSRELAAEVCRLVDGLPLAVELAARREAVFGLAHLRDRLGEGLQVLDPARGGDRATAVSATVEWSYRLLDPAAQRLLDRLAVCRGGFGLDALPYFADDAEPLLAELVDASLVVCDLEAEPPRYRLLDTVRHVGLAHLRSDDARDAHARWMLDFVTDLVRRQRRRNPHTTPALRRELGNLQEAIAWLGDRDEGARLAAWAAVAGSDAPDPGLTAQLVRCAPSSVMSESDALRAFAAGTGEWLNSNLGEAERLLAAALAVLPPGHPVRGPAILIRISNSMFAGRADDVRADALLLLDEPSATGWVRVTGLCCAALMDAYNGDPAAGMDWLKTYEKELTADKGDGFEPFTRGELLAASDPVAALECYEESLRRTTRAGLNYTANIARIGRAAVLIRLGRHKEAAEACREAIAAVRAAGMTAQLWTLLRLTAELLADRGDHAAAAAIVAAADADPYAPAVMGPDRDRLERLRAAATPPETDAAEFALARLQQAAGKGRTAR